MDRLEEQAQQVAEAFGAALRPHIDNVQSAAETMGAATAQRTARHDPRDTLARIDGERRVLDQYERAVDLYDRESEAPDGVAALETAVRALASGYRHRAGWQEGWAP